MTNRPLANITASVHQRLLNLARETDQPFNDLLQHYGLERFLYRISRSKHADRFVLKGALLLRVWGVSSYRPTRDIDLLSRIGNQVDEIVAVIKEICVESVEPDGLEFDADSIETNTITEDADYQGVRVTFRGRLGNARIAMQIDIGFGDVVTPDPTEIEYPTLLDMPAPKLLAYQRETSIAEKFQVMLHREVLNSRMKDFFDIWLLSHEFSFDGSVLADAIAKTCVRRNTPVVAEAIVFSSGFAEDLIKQQQWQALHRRMEKTEAPQRFTEIAAAIRLFLAPIAVALANKQSFDKIWRPGGPWM